MAHGTIAAEQHKAFNNGVGSATLGIVMTFLLAACMVAYFLFAAFQPSVLAVPLKSGKPTTLWFVLGVGLIATSVILGAIYVFVANRAADRAKPPLRLLALIGLGAALSAMPQNAWAADAAASAGLNGVAISMFVVMVLGTLGITWWSARRNRSAKEFYAGGGELTGLQNGLAIAGDAISAGAFLGLAGLVYTAGFDGLIYAVGYAVSYPVILLLFADRMRNLGRYTFADVISYRLKQAPVRAFAAASTLIITIFYLIAQMVGAGQLVQLLFGLDYVYAECIIGALMVCYVIFGGMTATSWVQMIKAVLMLVAGTTIAVLALARFGFDYNAMLTQAVALHPKHDAILLPQSFQLTPISTLSLLAAQFCGSAGLPHIIMRFFTVPDARTARSSMLCGSLFICYFFALVFVIGFAGIALVMGNPAYVTSSGALVGGGNMAAIHLAHAVGGDAMLGFVAAVAFATILAVVAGLTLSGASAISHDLYASILRPGRSNEKTEVRLSKVATLALGIIAVLLGIAFRTQNVAYMISLVVGIAAASNFPLLVLAIYWRGLTTRGAVFGGLVGLLGSLGCTILGASIWVKVLGYATPIFPIDSPTLVVMPAAFLTCILVSMLDRSRRGTQDRAGFAQQHQRMTGSRSLTEPVAEMAD